MRITRTLHFLGQPFLQLVERLAAMRDLVLLRLVHLGIRLTFVLEG